MELSTNELERIVDNAYECGLSQDLLDELETMLAERISEEDINKFGNPIQGEEDPNMGEGDIAGSDLDEAMIVIYYRWLNPKTRIGLTDEEFISGLRGAVEEMSKQPLKSEVTNEQILDAAKDLYEWKLKLIERRKNGILSKWKRSS